MACNADASLVAACLSQIGSVQDPVLLLQVAAQSALQWAQARNAGVDYSIEAIRARACASQIGSVTSQIILLQVTAQNLCSASS